jgi:aerobic carbon-monoxide dehydrogenase large subunit
LNPLGVKGVGEAGTVPAAGAIISAIENALSDYAIRVSDIPLAPAELFGLIQRSSPGRTNDQRTLE